MGCMHRHKVKAVTCYSVNSNGNRTVFLHNSISYNMLVLSHQQNPQTTTVHASNGLCMWTTVKNCSPPRLTFAFLHYSEKLSRVQDVFRATDTALKMLPNRTGCYINFGTRLSLTSLTGRVRNGFPLLKYFGYTIYMLEWKWAYTSNTNVYKQFALWLSNSFSCAQFMLFYAAVLKQNMEIKHTELF